MNAARFARELIQDGVDAKLARSLAEHLADELDRTVATREHVELVVTREVQQLRVAFAGSVGGWPPFADTVSALHRLKSAGFILGVLSNVDDASFANTHRQLDRLIDEVVTAEAVRSYKPGQRHFHAMIERLARRGIARDEILHVAQSRFHDIAPAQRLGLATVWVDRRANRPGCGITIAADAAPDRRVESLSELLDAMAVPPAGAQH